MVVKFHNAGASDHYLMEVTSHGLNKFISFTTDKRWLYALYDSKDAMPVMVEDLGNGCVTMQNKWPGEEGKFVSFTTDGKWLRAAYPRSEAMPIELAEEVPMLGLAGRMFKMRNRYSGEDKWVSFASSGKSIRATYKE